MVGATDLTPEEAREFEGQPKGFPFGDFSLDDVMLPDGDDFGVPSDDGSDGEGEVVAETGFGSVIGAWIERGGRGGGVRVAAAGACLLAARAGRSMNRIRPWRRRERDAASPPRVARAGGRAPTPPIPPPPPSPGRPAPGRPRQIRQAGRGRAQAGGRRGADRRR
jgi:hypothetical protein